MADERFGGSVRSIAGDADTRNSQTSNDNQGVVGQVSDTMRTAYDKTVESASEGAQAVKDAAIAGHDFLKKVMEENPHTTTMVALGIGLLIGYAAHRPPRRRGWWD